LCTTPLGGPRAHRTALERRQHLLGAQLPQCIESRRLCIDGRSVVTHGAIGLEESGAISLGRDILTRRGHGQQHQRADNDEPS
jgi:hypothetical protein